MRERVGGRAWRERAKGPIKAAYRAQPAPRSSLRTSRQQESERARVPVMDFVVYPGSRIAGLPPVLRLPALLVRNLVRRRAAERFVYSGDGLATDHFSPFLVDPVFSDLYDRMAAHWFDRPIDVRWRMWILTQCARHCVALPGSFVEFGVYRAGCAFMILSTAQLQPDRPFYLFDTFQGIPHT